MLQEKETYSPDFIPAVDNFVDLLMEQAVRRKGKLAYGFLKNGETLEETYTFDTLEQRVRVVAARLQQLDLEGERALLLYPSGLDYVVAFLACLYARVIAVPVYPPQMGRQMGRIDAIVKDAQAKVFLTNRAVFTKIETHLPEMMELVAGNWVLTDEVHHTSKSWEKPPVQANTIAFLQYTSGSTGNPKGVMVTHGNLLANERVICELKNNDQNTIHVSWLPLFHDMGLIGIVLQSLFLGTPAYLMSPLSFLQKPLRWLRAISTYGGTVSGAPNFAFSLCAERATPEEIAALDLSSWRIAFNGAEPVRVETMRKFQEVFSSANLLPGAQYPGYGLAENTLMVSGGINTHFPLVVHVDNEALKQHKLKYLDGTHPHAQAVVSCGHTAIGHKAIIVHPETLDTCAPDQVGEIWVSGPSVAKGYWNRPQETRETFLAFTSDTGEGPFLRTGDLGFLQEGELFITGRIKDLIIIRGKNHYPQDIELTVEQSYANLRAGGGAAFSIEAAGAERLVVIHEVNSGLFRNVDHTAIFSAIREAIAQAHDIQVYTILLVKRRSVLKTSSGKIMRQACRKAYLEQKLKVVASWVAPTTDLDIQLAKDDLPRTARDIQQFIFQWIHQTLKVPLDKIEAHDTITSYGADSLMIAEFETQISEFVGFKWPIMDFLLIDPSIEEVCYKGEELIRQHRE